MAMNVILVERSAEMWLSECEGEGAVLVNAGEAGVRGELVAKEKGLLAGISLAEVALKKSGCEVEWMGEEGESVDEGDSVCVLMGGAESVLRAQETVRRVLGRAGAVAFAAKQLTEKVGPKIEVRASAWGLEAIQGLRTGGIRPPERLSITKNHIILAGGLKQALYSLRINHGIFAKAQVLCDNKQEALDAAAAGANIIMLNNMKPVDVKSLSKQIKDTYPLVLVGVNGLINEKNISDYAIDNIDIISSNIFNQGYKCIDYSFNIVNEIKIKNIETVKDAKVDITVEPITVENKDKANESVDLDSKAAPTPKSSLKRKVDEISGKTEENKIIAITVDNSKKDNKKPEEKIQKANVVKSSRPQQRNERPQNKMQRLSSVNKSSGGYVKNASSARMPGYPVSMSTPRAPNGNNLLRLMAGNLNMSFPGSQANDAFFRGAAPPMRYGSTMGRNGPGAMNSLPDQRNLGSQYNPNGNNSNFRYF